MEFHKGSCNVLRSLIAMGNPVVIQTNDITGIRIDPVDYYYRIPELLRFIKNRKVIIFTVTLSQYQDYTANCIIDKILKNEVN